MIVGLARPQRAHSRTEVTANGIDIVLGLDVSGSMQALDFPDRRSARQPHRSGQVGGLEIHRRTAQRPHRPHRLCRRPLPGESAHPRPRLAAAESRARQHGRRQRGRHRHRLGDCRGRQPSAHHHAKSKIVVLLTDGINNIGKISPIAAAEAAKALGVKIYTIGVGVRGMAPIPVHDQNGNIHLVMDKVDVDEKTLQTVADATGGTFYRATDTDSLRKDLRRDQSSGEDRADRAEIRAPRRALFLGADPGGRCCSGLACCCSTRASGGCRELQPSWWLAGRTRRLSRAPRGCGAATMSASTRRSRASSRRTCAVELTQSVSIGRRRIATRPVARGARPAVRRARRTAGRLSLGASQPPRHRNRLCRGYLAQHVDARCEARPAHARQARHRRLHQQLGRATAWDWWPSPATPSSVCPVTLDYGAFHESLSAIDVNTIPRGGTDIASAIREAAGRAAPPSQQRQDSDPGHRRRGSRRRRIDRRPGRGASGRPQDLHRRRGHRAGRSHSPVGQTRMPASSRTSPAPSSNPISTSPRSRPLPPPPADNMRRSGRKARVSRPSINAASRPCSSTISPRVSSASIFSAINGRCRQRWRCCS